MGYIEKGRAKTFTKIILWLVVISFVAAIFVTWGAQRSGIHFGSATAMTVDGTTLSKDDIEFHQSFYRFAQFRLQSELPILETYIWQKVSMEIGQSLGTSILQYAGEQGLDPLAYNIFFVIGDFVLSEKAKTVGLRVNQKEIDDLILKAYSDEKGAFKKDELEKDLRRYGIGSHRLEKFKEQMRRHLLARRYANLLMAATTPSLDKELHELFELENEYFTIHYVRFNRIEFQDKVDTATANLKAYLSENTDEFVVAEMMEFSVNEFKNSLEITDDAVKAEYAKIKKEEQLQDEEEYYLPERRSFQRILIKLPPMEGAAEDQEAWDAAQEIIAGIKKDLEEPGIEFDTVARKHSAENEKVVSTTVTDVTLKDIQDADFVRGDAVFGLKNEGDVNLENPVRTNEGLEIIKLVKTTPGSYKPLEEVKDLLIERIRDERTEEEAEAKADDLRREAEEGDWKELADKYSYLTLWPKVAAVEGEDEIIYGVDSEKPKEPENVEILLNTDEGKTTELMELLGADDDGYLFFRVKATGESLEEEFDFLSEAVKGRYKRVKGLELAEESAGRFAEAVEGVTDIGEFSAAAADAGIEALTETTSRLEAMAQDTESFNPFVGNFVRSDRLEEAAKVSPPAIAGPVREGDTFYVLLVSDRSELDEDDFIEAVPGLRKMLYCVWLQIIPDILLEQENVRPLDQYFFQMWQQAPQFRPQLISNRLEQFGYDRKLVSLVAQMQTDFSKLLDAQISYLVAKTDLIPNRDVLRAIIRREGAPSGPPPSMPGYY